MSRTFRVAAGGLLLAVAGVLLSASGEAQGDPAVIRLVAALFAIPGLILLAAGLRSPFDASVSHLVKRKLTPSNLIIGPVVIAASLGVLYLFFNVVFVMPKILVFGAALGVLVGVFLTASVQGDACVPCDRLLESATIPFTADANGFWPRIRSNSAEALDALGQPAHTGSFELSFGFCPSCKEVAVLRPPQGGPVVLMGDRAMRLAELAKGGAASGGAMSFT